MPDLWDVIIVGAGVGGLTAASELVKKGLRVLILDKNPHPGGTAYVYHRKGFTFPMGPLGFSMPRLIRENLNISGGDDLKLLPVQYRIKAFGLEIPLSLSFPKMTEELAKLFPEERGSIEQCFKDMEVIVSAMQHPDNDLNRSLLQDISKRSSLEYLSDKVKDGRLRRILGSMGTQEPYSNLPWTAAMWNLMSNEKIWYPAGGMREFCERLVRLAVGHPENRRGVGEIKLGAEVSGIRVERGKVLGVALKDGTVMDSAVIISNADYKTTFITLTDPRAVPEEWRRAALKAKQTKSVLQVCLGVDTSQVDLSAFDEADRLIYKRDVGISSETLSKGAEAIPPEVFASQELEISLWSKTDNALGPIGTGVIVIRTEADHSPFKRFRPAQGIRIPEYGDYKIRLGRALVHEAENLIPGLEKAALAVDIATPLTFEEQGGRSEGAVAGWSWDYRDCQDYSPRELVRTPVEGLYMAGYQAFSTIFM
ncbi:MAG TPA: NAD(P)/FAD-dependent oxidoreductase, partial [Thermodesulfobacteriota bacterium]|nr:NAD(P)/FAD-dependent oxidoreductase [Thermodesulfobacteriota bacterium]